jgi:apolipoprotein N-acyltransferase
MSFPFVWTAFEWLHSLGDIGYPWLSLGYTQALNLHWIQVVDLAGVWGASFLVVWANVALVEVLRLWLQAQARGGSVRQWLRRWDVRGWMGVGLAVVVLPMLYGSLRLEQLRMHPTERTLRAILVQPNVNPWAKWERTAVEQIYLQQRLADTLLERDRADLVVWNETAIPLPLTLPEYRWVWESVQAWVRYRQVALLSGFAELRVYRTEEAPRFARPLPWDSTRRYEAYNAAFLLGSTGELLGIYRKIRLTPFAERFPYAELFGELTRLFEWGVGISAWAKGGEQRLLLLPRRLGDTVALGVAICIESIFPDFMRAYARQGADVLVVISNDAWFDHTPGPMQHFAIARVRAIELRRPLLRCANSGVTAAVLPTGEVLAQLPQYEAAALPVVLPLRREQSLYERFGEGLPHAATGVSLLLLGVALWRKSVPLEKP